MLLVNWLGGSKQSWDPNKILFYVRQTWETQLIQVICLWGEDHLFENLFELKDENSFNSKRFSHGWSSSLLEGGPSFFTGPFFRKHFVKSVQIRSISPYSVRTRENTDQKKLRIWTLFTQWNLQKAQNRSYLVCWLKHKCSVKLRNSLQQKNVVHFNNCGNMFLKIPVNVQFPRGN